MQAHKELDASASDTAELEDKLTAAHRKLQRQEEERQEAESARAEQGLQLTALAQDMKALHLALERVKQDRQQVDHNPPLLSFLANVSTETLCIFLLLLERHRQAQSVIHRLAGTGSSIMHATQRVMLPDSASFRQHAAYPVRNAGFMRLSKHSLTGSHLG